jgi:hypothetical protein
MAIVFGFFGRSFVILNLFFHLSSSIKVACIKKKDKISAKFY